MLSNDGEQCRNRGQVSGVRGQVLGFRGYSLLIIKHSLSIEKIFIRTLSSNLEHSDCVAISINTLGAFILFWIRLCNAQ